MAEFFNFGSGSDGQLLISSPTTWGTSTAQCAGTSGTNSITTSTTLSVSNGDFVFIHQLQGSAANPEINQIVSGAGTSTLTLATPLTTTYSYSGTNRAYIQRVPQYSSGSITSALSAQAYTGAIGGYIVLCVSGVLTIGSGGSITTSGKGFRAGEGGSAITDVCDTGDTGESSLLVGTIAGTSGTLGGSPSPTIATNGCAGQGAQGKRSDDSAAGGGGGANTGAGTAGQDSIGGGNPAVSGGATGSTLSTVSFGGGGGGGGKSKDNPGFGVLKAGGDGGAGGGIIYIYAKYIDCSAGGIFANGSDGSNAASSTSAGAGGGGAGGRIKIWTADGVFGTNKVLALGGSGGTGDGSGGDGGSGGVGAISITSCSYTGTTNPTATFSTGGHDFCSTVSFIM